MQPTQGIDLVFCYRLRVAGKSRGKNERDEQRIPTVTYRRNGKLWSKNICRGLNDPTLDFTGQTVR